MAEIDLAKQRSALADVLLEIPQDKPDRQGLYD